jgi:uncharacterized membrane protein (TIGR02234 family)
MTGRPHLTGRRGLLVALAGYVVAGAIVLLAAGRTWGRAALTAETGAHVAVSATGREAEAALPALGFALLVLAAAVLAARGWLRVIVGVITVAVGGIVIGLALTSTEGVSEALRQEAFAVPAGAVHTSLGGWAVVTAAAGAIAVLAGVVTVVRGSSWPGLGARYDAPAGESPAGERKPEPATAAWDALDRGEDPTE